MRVIVSQATCEGTGYCQQLCPEVFSAGPDGKAVADPAAAAATSPDDLLEAERMCPTSAIRIDNTTDDQPAQAGTG